MVSGWLGEWIFYDFEVDLGSVWAPKIHKKRHRFRDGFSERSKSGLRRLADRFQSPRPPLRIPKGILGPEDQEPGTGTGARDLTRRGPVARRIFSEKKYLLG